ncbi:MAG: hypothetical protein AB8G05_28065 [Oligoflexales bacterium]
MSLFPKKNNLAIVLCLFSTISLTHPVLADGDSHYKKSHNKQCFLVAVGLLAAGTITGVGSGLIQVSF